MEDLRYIGKMLNKALQSLKTELNVAIQKAPEDEKNYLTEKRNELFEAMKTGDIDKINSLKDEFTKIVKGGSDA